jgi:hypothetical protein
MRLRLFGRLLPALILAALPMAASAGLFIGVSVGVAPPPLPIYVQPPCPQPGYIWIPGYWAWGPYGYYWVPGTWALPPQVGLLWTPGYWGWDGADYLWHAGYWGPRVGFYGGIDYGFGYDGDGFDGGFWRGGIFFYNRAIMHVGPGFDSDEYYRRPPPHPVYWRHRFEHVSFNGGPDGVYARPTRMDMRAARERHFALTAQQRQHEFIARGDRALRANFNHGRPPIAATPRPSRFHGPDVFAARAAGGPFMHRSPLRRPMAMDRPGWAAGPQHPAQRAWQRYGNGPAPNFAAHPGRTAAFHAGNRFAPHPWNNPRYPQRQAYHPAPRFVAHPAPQYGYRAAPRVQYHPAPRFQAQPAPRYAYRPAPRFQPRPAPQYSYHPAYHPAPRFQPRPAPQYSYHPAYHPAYRPAPRFQAHARFQPHPGPRRPPR